MQKISILNFKILTLFILLLILFILFGIATIHNKINHLEQECYLQIAHSMYSSFGTLVDEKKESLTQLSLSMAQNSDIKKSLLQADAELVDMQTLSNALHGYTLLKNVWFQILTHDGKSFYRSWSSQKGDDVTFRPEVIEILDNPHLFISTSVGKYDLAFKAMVPIWHEEKLLGIFETVAKFNSIVKKMQREAFDVIILTQRKSQVLP